MNDEQIQLLARDVAAELELLRTSIATEKNMDLGEEPLLQMYEASRVCMAIHEGRYINNPNYKKQERIKPNIFEG